MIVLAARRKMTLDEFQQAAATHIKPKEYCFKLKGAKNTLAGRSQFQEF